MSIKASGKTKSYCKKKRAKVTSSETSVLLSPQTPRNILLEPHARCLVWKLQHLKHQQFQQLHQQRLCFHQDHAPTALQRMELAVNFPSSTALAPTPAAPLIKTPSFGAPQRWMGVEITLQETLTGVTVMQVVVQGMCVKFKTLGFLQSAKHNMQRPTRTYFSLATVTLTLMTFQAWLEASLLQLVFQHL